MVLKFLELMDKGDITKQRLVFEVIESGNLASCKKINEAFIKKNSVPVIESRYIFPDFEVKKGEYVVLYFKNGKQRTEKFVDGICHFFYWGL